MSARARIAGLLAVTLVLLFHAAGTLAQVKSDWELAEEARNWKEVEAKLPAYPKDQDLVEFFVSSASAFRFYLDSTSMSIGPEGDVRFTLVARSQSGADNVSFEGVRCKTGEYRAYAFGGAGGSWSMRPTEWKKIEFKSVQRWHAALGTEYLCDGRSPAASAADILRGVKTGIGLRDRRPSPR